MKDVKPTLKPVSPTSRSRIDGKDIFPKTVKERFLRAVFTREVWLQGHPQWNNSWTGSDTYEWLTGAFSTITFSDFPDHEFYFEMIGFTDAGTGHWGLYNITDGEILYESEITTTSTSPVRIRSGKITKPKGEVDLVIMQKVVGGGGGYVNSVMSRLVLRLP